MKILILLKSFNYPPKNGGDQAVFNAISKLNNMVDYHLLSTDGSTLGIESIRNFRKDYPNIPSVIYDLTKKDKYQRICEFLKRISNYINRRNGNAHIVDIIHSTSYDANADYFYNFYSFLNSYIKENSIDIVQSEFSFTLGWLKGITGNVKKVFVQHEIQFVVNYQRIMENINDEKLLFKYNMEKQQEINAMNACDAIITLSEDDKNKLIKNGVHTSIFPSFAQVTFKNVKIEYPIKLKKQLVFIGPETHEPNKHGLLWFLNEVFPLVLKEDNSIKLNIIGRWSESTIDKWKNKYSNIKFLGYVDNLEDAIRSSILIVPIFHGSGIRMKILEACNIGIPFISTIIGAEGLGFIPNEHCFITDIPNEFANNVLKLMQDQTLVNKFVFECKKHIFNNFSDKNFIESRIKCYKEVLNQ